MKKQIIIVGIILTLIIGGLCGCVDEKAEEQKFPTAAFDIEAITNILPEDTIYFIANSSSDSDGDITDYYWEFDDGTVSEGNYVSHAYTDKGSYNVSLLVVDDDGLSNRVTKTIEVYRIPKLFPIKISETSSDDYTIYNISITGAHTYDFDITMSDIYSSIRVRYFINSDEYNVYYNGTILSIEYFDDDNNEVISTGDYILFNDSTIKEYLNDLNGEATGSLTITYNMIYREREIGQAVLQI
ncbi:MAG: PKD domain-containing protein [Thermoplasmatales archaeon]|nr:PKD domain-containing protein [Thermoplasmatales archaeon]